MAKDKGKKTFREKGFVIHDEELEHILSATGDLTYIWYIESDELRWFGHPTVDIDLTRVETGKDFYSIINQNDLRAWGKKLKVKKDRSAFDREYRVLSEDGTSYWVNERGSVFMADDGSTEKIIGAIRVIDDRKEYESELRRRANRDSLTGLYNENYLRDILEDAIRMSHIENKSGAYVLISIDKLSLINTVHGTDHAEKVVLAFADLLESHMDEGDVLGRINTDHFGVILHNRNEEAVAAFLSSLQEKIRHTIISLNEETIYVTASMGCVLFSAFTFNSHDAMIRAETALYDAKDSGRNCYKYFSLSKSQHEVQHHALKTGEQVRLALAEKRTKFAFQPVVCPQTMQVKFYECLLRLDMGDEEPMEAKEFIEIAEQLGLTKQIDLLTLEMSLAILADNPDLHLAVNISAFNAEDGAWLQALLAGTYGHKDIAKRLIIEITETAAIADQEETARFAHIVRSIGCRIALDDFGEGYTTFRQLRKIPVDIVKVDGAFIQGVGSNMGNQLFLKTLMEVAHNNDFTIVAERVEESSEFDWLKDIGIDLLQGHYLGKPQIVSPKTLGMNGDIMCNPASPEDEDIEIES